MTKPCFICLKPSESGYHEVCIEISARIPSRSVTSCAVPCGHCPFRKDRPVWMD